MSADLNARLRAGAQDIEYDGYADLLREAAHALAAERDRADRAEARIADSPHDSKCKFPVLGWNCTCWKQEKDANGL